LRLRASRTGERRYALIATMPGEAAQTMSPAPGFDPHIQRKWAASDEDKEPFKVTKWVAARELGTRC